ncbi:hypothetical protein TNCV_1323771 [Trichonephila clavipes]|nr:hypothetical protein TNCV_1323771 [Trichonephila clavipes]
MEGDSGRGELVISAVSEKFRSKFVPADEKLVCYWSSGVGERELYSLRLVSTRWWSLPSSLVVTQSPNLNIHTELAGGAKRPFSSRGYYRIPLAWHSHRRSISYQSALPPRISEWV